MAEAAIPAQLARRLLDEVRSRREEAARFRSPVAIVGMACRFPGGPDSGIVLDVPRSRRRCGDARAARRVRRGRPHVGGLPAGDGSLRPRVLPHRAGRGRTPRPAAAPAAGGRLGGPRGRRVRSAQPGGQPHRRLCRDHGERLPGRRGSARGRFAARLPLRHREQFRHRDRPRGLHPRARGSGDRRGHGVFVVAGDDPPGGRRAPAGGGRPRARGRRERGPEPPRNPVVPRRRGRLPRMAAARRSTPPPTATSAARAAGCWCSSGSPTPNATATGSWECSWGRR